MCFHFSWVYLQVESMRNCCLAFGTFTEPFFPPKRGTIYVSTPVCERSKFPAALPVSVLICLFVDNCPKEGEMLLVSGLGLHLHYG